jgi:hypothetical protein
MKTKRVHDLVLILAMSLLLAACSPTALPEEAAGYSQPQVWFDAPLPGTEFPLGEVQVVAHGADKGGVMEMELSIVDGSLIGSQPGNGNETLMAAIFNWHPPEPGHYFLQIRAMSVSGDWSEYATTDVVIGADEVLAPTAETLIEEPTEEATPTSTIAAPVATETPEACTDRAAFVSETIPDGTAFKPGDAFTKTWTLRNAGTCTWTTRYALSFYNGDQMGGANQTQLPKEVLPGGQITLSANLTAPSQPGTYRGNWMLMNDQGKLFGLGEQAQTAFWVEIDVQQRDRRAPSVQVTYEPNRRGEPTGRQQVTFTANASDNVGVTKIEIYLTKTGSNSVLLGTCNNQNTCVVYGGPYPTGDYQLQAFAYDAVGNQGSSTIVNFTVYP